MSYVRIQLPTDADPNRAKKEFTSAFSKISGPAKIVSVREDDHTPGVLCARINGIPSPAQERHLQSYSL